MVSVVYVILVLTDPEVAPVGWSPRRKVTLWPLSLLKLKKASGVVHALRQILESDKNEGSDPQKHSADPAHPLVTAVAAETVQSGDASVALQKLTRNSAQAIQDLVVGGSLKSGGLV